MVEWLSLIKTCVDWFMKIFGYVKEKKQSEEEAAKAKHHKLVGDCAQVMRNFAAEWRRKQPNAYCVPKDRFTMQLGAHADLVDEVIDYMEQKGWAVKVKFPADCCDIR